MKILKAKNNTNAIEGSKITLEETREIIEDKISPNKPLRDVNETEQHAKVFLNMLDKKEKITKDLLLNWHSRIFGESKDDIAGKFRNHLVRVGEHLAPDWQDVEDLMKDFFNYANNKPEDINIVEFAAQVHFRFEKIHPFADGNKRVGSLLFVYFLDKNGHLRKTNGEPKFNDNTVVALSLLIAASDPREKETMIKIITNLLK